MSSAPSIATSVRADGSRAITRKPSMLSERIPAPDVSVTAAGSGPRTGATAAAPSTSSPAMTTHTVPGPWTASSTPATAGAMSTLALSFQPEKTLAAVSSSGRRARPGISTACVGRTITSAVVAAAAQPIASAGGPSSRSTTPVRPKPTASAR